MLTGTKRNCVFALMSLGLLASCGEQQSEFRLITPALEFDQLVAAELVEVFEQNSIHEITLVPMPDSFATPLDAIEAGYADLAFASNAQPYRQGVTTVMPLYPTVLHVMYKRDRDASDTRRLLQDAKIFTGSAGSSSRQATMAILGGLDLTEEDVSFVVHPSELPDVVVIFIPVSPVEFDARLAAIGGAEQYSLLGFGSPAEIGKGSAVDRAVFLNPRLSAFVIPVDTYKGMVPEPVVTLAVDKLLVANPDVPAAAIYDLIGEIRRLQPALSANQPMLFSHLSEEFDAGSSTFVLHPGSQAFTQRDEPDVYERYSGVAEVLVTLVIGLVSGSYAVVQIYNRRRKNRIDVFYKRAIAIRDSVTADSSGSERAAAIVDIRKLQNSAFEMLVDEKVAADDSFRIFVTLSNDILTELGARRGPTSA
jgi:hypothetical protein